MPAMPRQLLLACLGALLAGVPAAAQQSTSFRQEEHALNQGGHPEDGDVPRSASFRVSLDTLGEGAATTGLSSASYQVDAGFPTSYAPPGEVEDLRFASPTTLQWDPDPSRGTYALYRGSLSTLPGTYGSCLGAPIPVESASDPALPPPGEVFFYLVTARNRVGEEGTLGYQSGGAERPNPGPCPP